jgi:hypothetical protein
MTWLAACSANILLVLLFDAEDGGDAFSRNVGLSPNYRALQSRLLLLLLLLLWLYSPLLELGRFFSFLILYTVRRTPWIEDQPVARPLPTRRTTQTLQ